MLSSQIRLLERFVLRARIVQDHSLARDIGVLRNLAREQVKVVITRNLKTGETSTELKPVDLLPAEQVESAAARVRPVFLKKDKVHYATVLDALAGVLKGRSGTGNLVCRSRNCAPSSTRQILTTLMASLRCRGRVGH